MRKPTMWFSNRSDTSQPVQSQKMARSLKFWIKEEGDRTIHVEKTRALISFVVTAKLIFVRLCFRICRMLVFS